MLEVDQEIVREFLVESHENLSRLDQELVALEKEPQDAALLASIFRTMHTIKGTCGFLGFSILEAISHEAENLLSQLRDGKRRFTPPLGSLILETVDATRRVLASIEASGGEGPEKFEALIGRLRAVAAGDPGQEPPAQPVISAQADDPTPREPTAPVPNEAVITTPSSAERRTAPPEEAAARVSQVADANIRVGVALLDKLMDLVGELVLTRNQILQCNSEREDAALNATSQRLNLITTELQEGVMKTRMQPIRVVWNQLPRVVRDMSVALGKQIRLELVGDETELDRSIIEAIRDPLVHLVRNACDHGIETPAERTAAGKSAEGTLTLRAYHEGGKVNIEIADDGAGIQVQRIREKAVEKGLLRPDQAEKLSEREALNLIFHPGFSTAQTVTNLSGRGVGMDVVKSHIDRIGGVVDLSTRSGEGTVVRLKIPLTLAIIPGLVIASGGERFVIPQVSLLELVRLEAESASRSIEDVHGTPVYRRRGRLLPLAYLNKVLDLSAPEQSESVNIVVLQAEDRQFGMVVDSISDTQEIVVKPLGKQLKGLEVYAGATIMGDGQIALILDVLGVGRRSGVLSGNRERARSGGEQQAQYRTEKQRLLLFTSGSFERLAVPLSLVARLEQFPRAALERAGGAPVVQYRDRILPLISLRAVLEPEATGPDELSGDPAQVIVFNVGDRSVGLLIDRIIDIVEETATVRQKGDRPGILGSAIIGKQVADFLDLQHIFAATLSESFGNTREAGAGKTVVLADSSAFARGVMRASLEMNGYRVLEASSESEALRCLEDSAVDAVLAAVDLPPAEGQSLAKVMRDSRIPVLPLTGPGAQPAQAGECCNKCDSAAVLRVLVSLTTAEPTEPARA